MKALRTMLVAGFAALTPVTAASAQTADIQTAVQNVVDQVCPPPTDDDKKCDFHAYPRALREVAQAMFGPAKDDISYMVAKRDFAGLTHAYKESTQRIRAAAASQSRDPQLQNDLLDVAMEHQILAENARIKRFTSAMIPNPAARR